MANIALYPTAIKATDLAPLVIRSATGSFSDIALLGSVIDSVALAEMETADLKAEWPDEIVAKASARRRQETIFISSPTCFQIGAGEVPFEELFGEGGNIFAAVLRETPFLEVMTKWGCGRPADKNAGFYNVFMNINRPDVAALSLQQAWQNLIGDVGSQRAFCEQLSGFLPPSSAEYSVRWVSSQIGSSALVTSLKDESPAGFTTLFFLWRMSSGKANPEDANSNGGYLLRISFPSLPGTTGLRMMFFDSPVSPSPTNGGEYALYSAFTTPNSPEYSLSRVVFKQSMLWADQNWCNVAAVLRGSPTRTAFSAVTPGAFGYGFQIGDSAETCFEPLIVPEPASLPNPVIPGLRRVPGWGGPASRGIHTYRVHAYGNPEFALGMTVKGTFSLAQDVIDRTIMTVADTHKMFTWSGNFLADMEEARVRMGGDPSGEDASEIRSLLLRSTVFTRQQNLPSDPLAKTDLFAKASKGEVDLRNEVMIPADPAKKADAVTFGQASQRASGQQVQVLHQFFRYRESLGDLKGVVITLTGTGPTGYTFSGVDVNGTPVMDPDEASIAVALGAKVVNTTDLTTDGALTAVFGLGSSDFSTVKDDKTNTELEFNEGILQDNVVFDPMILPEGQKCAYCCLAYSRPRTSLDNAISGFLTMGRLATKKMIRSLAIKPSQP